MQKLTISSDRLLSLRFQPLGYKTYEPLLSVKATGMSFSMFSPLLKGYLELLVALLILLYPNQSFSQPERKSPMNESPVFTTLHQALEQWSPKDLKHPYLFLDGSLASWQQKAKDLPEVWKAIRESAGRFLQEPFPKDLMALTDRTMYLALVGLLENRADMQAQAYKCLETAIAEEDWVNHAHKPLKLDLWYSGTCARMALAYDWLYPSLTQSQRRTIERELVRRVKLFQEIQSARSEWWATATMNWRSVICGEMGVALLAILEDYPEWKETLSLAIEGVIASLDAQGKDGSYPEGVGYWGYGVGQAGWLAAALKGVSKGALDLFAHPYLKITGDWVLHFATPDGGVFGFEDGSHEGRPNPWLVALLAREYRRPDYQSLAFEAHNTSLLAFLFYDLTLKPRPLHGKTAAYFPDIETVACRSDWSDRATFFGLHAGKTTVNHSHLDIGTFILSGRGERLASDPGVWPYDVGSLFFNSAGPRWDYEANATVGHNTILVDGQGQVYDAKAEGKILATHFGEEADTIVCDASAAYGGKLHQFIRYAAFLKPDIVVLVDDLKANDQSQFAWLLHPTGEAKLDGTRWHLTKGRAALEVRFLGFDELETGTGYRTGLAERTTRYRERNGIPVTRVNRYLSFETLHAVSEWLVPVVLKVGDAERGEAIQAEMKRSDGKVSLKIQDGTTRWSVILDRGEHTIQTGREKQ